MNLALQKENYDLYNAYSSLEKYCKVILKPLKQPLNEDSTLESFISSSNLSIPSAKVTEMLRECGEQHYLPETEIAQVKATFIEYAKKLEQAFKARFPEMHALLGPLQPKATTLRNSKISAKFTKHIDSSKLEMQYTLYCKDDVVKILFNSD
ncbi:unnamed protein product [Caretta caretta]